MTCDTCDDWTRTQRFEWTDRGRGVKYRKAVHRKLGARSDSPSREGGSRSGNWNVHGMWNVERENPTQLLHSLDSQRERRAEKLTAAPE